MSFIEEYLNENKKSINPVRFSEVLDDFGGQCKRYLERKTQRDVKYTQRIDEGRKYAKFKYRFDNESVSKVAVEVNYKNERFQIKSGFHLYRKNGNDDMSVKSVNKKKTFTELQRMACKDVLGWAVDSLDLNRNNRKVRTKQQ